MSKISPESIPQVYLKYILSVLPRESHSMDLFLTTKSPQKYMTLIRLTSKGQKANEVFEPPYSFEHGAFGLANLQPNH